MALLLDIVTISKFREKAADFRAFLGISNSDTLIAATAQVHGLTLATRNFSDFAQSGVTVINPWEFST